MWKWINKFLANCIIPIITLYQKTLSPDKGRFSSLFQWTVCRHIPHCSQYGKEVLEKYGFIPGIGYLLERISQCTPWKTHVYDPSSYRIVLFSWAQLSLPFFEAIAQDPRFEIVGIVSQQPKPQWRWMITKDNPVASFGYTLAKKLGKDPEMFVQTPSSLRTDSPKYADQAKIFKEWYTACNPDLALILAYGKILPQEILDIPYFGSMNVHGSLLPKYRWASPFQSVLLEEQTETGITLMKMISELDAWPIIKTMSFPLSTTMTVADIITTVTKYWPKFVTNTLREYGKWRISPLPQDNDAVTFCKKIQKNDGLIYILDEPMHVIYAKRKAYLLWPKIFTYWHETQKRRIRANEEIERSEGETAWLPQWPRKRVIIDEILLHHDHEQKRPDYKNAHIIKNSWWKVEKTIGNSEWNTLYNPLIKTILVHKEGKKPCELSVYLSTYATHG
jgi:methionyl-tRNA formyltransferase